MAKKGQKQQQYSPELKAEALEAYHSGISASALREQYGVPKGTIFTWQRKIKYDIPDKPRGRPKEDQDYKAQVEILKKYQAFLKAQRKKK